MELAREQWQEADYGKFTEYLQSLAEEKYREFSSALTPGTDNMLGVRMPILRKIAKEILKGNFAGFLALKKGTGHEEGIIEGLVMAGARCPYAEMLELMKRYSGVIYNWAMCDTVCFKGVKRHRREFFADVDWFLKNDNPWAVRFGLLHLMSFYLDEEYIDAVIEKTRAAQSDFYYVNMMQAWLLATAVAKCRDKTIAALEAGGFSEVVMKMTVRKVRDSYRVSAADKELVRRLIE